MNLKKEDRMNTGQVGFKDEAFRTILKNVEKDKEVLKRLEKTRVERTPDFAKEKEERDNDERARRKKFLAAERQKQKEEEKEHAKMKEQKEYTALQHLEK